MKKKIPKILSLAFEEVIKQTHFLLHCFSTFSPLCILIPPIYIYMQSCVLRPHKSYVCLISSTKWFSLNFKKGNHVLYVDHDEQNGCVRGCEDFFSKEEAIVSAVLMHSGQCQWCKLHKLILKNFKVLLKKYHILQKLLSD